MDWAYYKERLGSAIQKIITIPAAMQRVENPVPRIKHPDWLHKMIAEKTDTRKQTKISGFGFKVKGHAGPMVDLEDIGTQRRVLQPVTQEIEEHQDISIEATGAIDPTKEDDRSGSPRISPATPVNRNTDFNEWIKARKESWRKNRIKRKRDKEMREKEDKQKQIRTARAGLEGLFAQQSDAITQHSWSIVSIAPTDMPGIYKTWCVINGRMHGIMVKVPRRIFLTAALSPEDPVIQSLGGSPARKRPPEGDGHYVYEIIFDEKYYRTNLTELQAKMTSRPGIKGVHEAQVPPHWTAALSLGCMVNVRQSARSNNVGDGVHLHELEPVPVSKHGYFEEGRDLKHMMLYHVEDASTGRGLFGIHVPDEGRAYLWVVSPARGGQKEITSPVVDKIWEETRKEMQGQEYDEQLDRIFLDGAPSQQVLYARTNQAAYKLIRKVLRGIRYGVRGRSQHTSPCPDS